MTKPKKEVRHFKIFLVSLKTNEVELTCSYKTRKISDLRFEEFVLEELENCCQEHYYTCFAVTKGKFKGFMKGLVK